MVRRIRAHFDGKVIVPDEPVDLPIDQPLSVDIRDGLGMINGVPTPGQIAERLENVRRVAGMISAPSLPDAAFDRDGLYDERL